MLCVRRTGVVAANAGWVFQPGGHKAVISLQSLLRLLGDSMDLSARQA